MLSLKKILLGLLANIILISNVFAGEIETKKVISTGVGLTEADALKDATRSAVQQVVGVYILSETYSKNAQIIKDNILVNSNGYVKTFKVISQSKDDSGLIRIEAEVEVEPSQVTKRLGELNIALKDVATMELKAISLDKFQSSKDFKAMCEEIILKPIKENKKIYTIRIGELKNISEAELHETFGYNREVCSEFDRDKIAKGEALAFELSFFIGLNEDYIKPVEMFLKKNSKEATYIPNNTLYTSNTVIFHKKYNGSYFYDKYYKFNEINEKIYYNLIKDISIFPHLIVKFFDSSQNIYKNMNINLGSNNIECISDITSFLSDRYAPLIKIEYDYISFYGKEEKEFKIALYLSEEDIKNIKSTSIEIKWE